MEGEGEAGPEQTGLATTVGILLFNPKRSGCHDEGRFRY